MVLIREKVFEELERLEDIHGQKRFALTKFRFVALPFGGSRVGHPHIQHVRIQAARSFHLAGRCTCSIRSEPLYRRVSSRTERADIFFHFWVRILLGCGTDQRKILAETKKQSKNFIDSLRNMEYNIRFESILPASSMLFVSFPQSS